MAGPGAAGGQNRPEIASFVKEQLAGALTLGQGTSARAAGGSKIPLRVARREKGRSGENGGTRRVDGGGAVPLRIWEEGRREPFLRPKRRYCKVLSPRASTRSPDFPIFALSFFVSN